VSTIASRLDPATRERVLGCLDEASWRWPRSAISSTRLSAGACLG